MAECTHANGFYWYLAPCDEAGWQCSSCDHKPGEPPGFAPELDRAQIHDKVSAILSELHEGNFIYISNSDEGFGLEDAISKRCEREGIYDQWSIILFIMEAMQPRHAKYWQEISAGCRAGSDPRHRCACGKLATITTWGDDKREIRACSMECVEVAKRQGVLGF